MNGEHQAGYFMGRLVRAAVLLSIDLLVAVFSLLRDLICHILFGARTDDEAKDDSSADDPVYLKCPQCGQEYDGLNISFCPYDGTALERNNTL
jgi:hypothetical protein